MFLLLNAAGVAVQCFSLLCLFATILISGNLDFQKAFQPNQINALNLLFLNLHKSGFITAQIFYGTWLFPLGYLVYKSRFLPKWLGILLMADCFGVLIWFFQFFLLPGYDMITYPELAISFIAELSLSLWLLIMGVKEPKLSITEGINFLRKKLYAQIIYPLYLNPYLLILYTIEYQKHEYPSSDHQSI